MRKWRIGPGLFVAALALAACAPALREEPSLGMLKAGDVVRIDDGACAAGEVRKITVGAAPADKTQSSPRVSSCVAK